jgi:hypothetical protein
MDVCRVVLLNSVSCSTHLTGLQATLLIKLTQIGAHISYQAYITGIMHPRRHVFTDTDVQQEVIQDQMCACAAQS